MLKLWAFTPKLGDRMKNFNIIFTIMAVAVLGLAAYGFEEAEASHFRYTHMNWVQTPGTNEVTFGGDHAWRSCFQSGEVLNSIKRCGTLSFGDGTSVSYYMKITVDDNIGDFIFGPVTDISGKNTATILGNTTIENIAVSAIILRVH